MPGSTNFPGKVGLIGRQDWAKGGSGAQAPPWTALDPTLISYFLYRLVGILKAL